MHTLQRILISALLTFGLLSTGVAGEQYLRLQGSNTVGHSLAPALVEAWFAERGYGAVSREQLAKEEVRLSAESGEGERMVVDIIAHGSSTAFKALAAGEADLGMASRPIKQKELAMLSAQGDLSAPDSEYVIALDGVAVIVHPDNPIVRIDTATLRRIFTGEVQDWKELGGKPGKIHVYARDDASGTYDTFRSLVLGKKVQLTKKARRFDSNAELSVTVASDPQGIGFVSLADVGTNHALAVNDAEGISLSPEAFTIATEDYALARRLFFYVPAGGNPLAQEFASFAISHAGQQVVKAEGLVGQQLMTAMPSLPESGPDEYLQLVDGAERFSINFRFNEGKVVIDNKARDDVQRLLSHLDTKEHDVHELILVGFSDRHEALPIYSLELSISRADLIADLLNKMGVHRVLVRGYGSALPVASNDSAEGRYKNRRVEVWVR